MMLTTINSLLSLALLAGYLLALKTLWGLRSLPDPSTLPKSSGEQAEEAFAQGSNTLRRQLLWCSGGCLIKMCVILADSGSVSPTSTALLYLVAALLLHKASEMISYNLRLKAMLKRLEKAWDIATNGVPSPASAQTNIHNSSPHRKSELSAVSKALEQKGITANWAGIN